MERLILQILLLTATLYVKDINHLSNHWIGQMFSVGQNLLKLPSQTNNSQNSSGVKV